MHPGALIVVRLNSEGSALPQDSSLSAAVVEGTTANYRVCVKWKEAKAALAMWTPVVRSKEGSAPSLAAPKAKRADPSAQQENLGPGWNHVVRGGCVVRAIPADILHNADPLTLTPTPPVGTNSSAKCKTVKSAPKITVCPEQTPQTTSDKAAKLTRISQPKTKKLVALARPDQSPIEISDLLDNLPLKECLELTRSLLTSVPTFPSGPARLRAALKIVILFITEYDSTA
jgi:hypothetical protein